VVWSARRRRELDEADPTLPLLPGEVSNGEFVPREPSSRDRASRAIVEQMKTDEARHATEARQAGARPLPLPLRWAMRLASRVMTSTAHHI